MSDFFKIIECECGNQVCHLQSINNLCPDCVKKKLAEIKQLEDEIKEWELTVDENGVIIEQLSADKKSIEKDRLAIATKYNNQMIENQRLKDDIVKLQAKQFKDLAEIALKWEQKNQRLRETVERLIDDGGLSEHLRRILQKALKGK